MGTSQRELCAGLPPPQLQHSDQSRGSLQIPTRHRFKYPKTYDGVSPLSEFLMCIILRQNQFSNVETTVSTNTLSLIESYFHLLTHLQIGSFQMSFELVEFLQKGLVSHTSSFLSFLYFFQVFLQLHAFHFNSTGGKYTVLKEHETKANPRMPTGFLQAHADRHSRRSCPQPQRSRRSSAPAPRAPLDS